MKLAVSNIAWQPAEDEVVAATMREFGVAGVEIAPTKLWADPLKVDDGEIRAVRRFWESRGIRIVALQALLFGRPDLVIFGSSDKRVETKRYLAEIIALGRKLGAEVLVFGSPRSRRVGDLPPSAIDAIAVEFFAALARVAHTHEVVFCIEPNPAVYGCDFITTSTEGAALVHKVSHPGFGLHLDAAAMTLSGEDIGAALHGTLGVVQHFHISEPNLAPIGGGPVLHELFAGALKREGYRRWVSIEMKAQRRGDNAGAVATALSRARAAYGS